MEQVLLFIQVSLGHHNIFPLCLKKVQLGPLSKLQEIIRIISKKLEINAIFGVNASDLLLGQLGIKVLDDFVGDGMIMLDFQPIFAFLIVAQKFH